MGMSKGGWSLSFFLPNQAAAPIGRAQHQQKPGEVESSSIKMVTGLQPQSGPPIARITRAHGQPAAPRQLLPRRPLPRFRLQSSDTSSRKAGPSGRGLRAGLGLGAERTLYFRIRLGPAFARLPGVAVCQVSRDWRGKIAALLSQAAKWNPFPVGAFTLGAATQKG